MPREAVRAHAQKLLRAGAFPRPWRPGAQLAHVLQACTAEDADACFALLVSAEVEGTEPHPAEAEMEGGGPIMVGRASWPVLHAAAARNFVATTRLLLDVGGVDLHLPDSFDGLMALDAAITARSVRAANLLLDKGARPSQAQDALLVAAGHAVDPASVVLARRLVTQGLSDVDATIDLAMEYEDVDVVLCLLCFPEASRRRWVEQWALRRAAVLGDAVLMERALALPSVDVNYGAESSVGPALLLAAEAGHAESCRRLLLRRADPCAARVCSRGRWTATDLAALRGHLQVLRALAEFGGPRAGEEPGGNPGVAAVIALSRHLAGLTTEHGDA